ncbi:SseB family protein [Streptomyces sp. NPDC127039]|uniref:SseB family protein n=1 Tax=Streptomyces sp. NPDC127039 TaxID=3347115 RepID=UPI0036597EF7
MTRQMSPPREAPVSASVAAEEAATAPLLNSPDGRAIRTASAARREFAALVGEFRRTLVLVPLVDDEAPLTGDHGGVRWIYAFTDESALARFATVRGDAAREWTYRRILGARLLDVAVPAAGVPCGVVVDAGSEEGVLLPPVSGVVPEAVAVRLDGDRGRFGNGDRDGEDRG